MYIQALPQSHKSPRNAKGHGSTFTDTFTGGKREALTRQLQSTVKKRKKKQEPGEHNCKCYFLFFPSLRAGWWELLATKSCWRDDSDRSCSVSKAGWLGRKLWVLNKEIFCHMPHFKKKSRPHSTNFAFEKEWLLSEGKLCCLGKAGDTQKVITLYFPVIPSEETAGDLTGSN